jgi:galactonate dehydratase
MGPVAGAVGLHFAVATPNFVILEEMAGMTPWYNDVIEGGIERRDGYWEIPTRPGLGIEINEREAAKHPFQQETFAGLSARISRDGTMANW